MPHVIVKLWPGKSEEQKARLAERISQAVIGRTRLRRGIRVGRDGRGQIQRLGKTGLSTGHQGKVGQTLQETRLHNVTRLQRKGGNL
jgi:hypothetical protein